MLAGGSTLGIALSPEFLYWTVYAPGGPQPGQGELLRCPLTGCTKSVAPTVVDQGMRPSLIALDRTYVYFTEAGGTSRPGSIRRCAVDGGGCSEIVPAASEPYGITATDAQLYWTADYMGTNGSIMSCALPACGSIVTVATKQPHPSHITSAQGHLYWTLEDRGGGLQTMKIDDSGAPPSPFGSPGFATGLAVDVDGGRIYWGDRELMQEAMLDAGAPALPVTSTPVMEARSIAVDEKNVYFIGDRGTTVNRIARGFATTTAIQKLATSDPSADGYWMEIAVGPTLIYWTTGNGNSVRCLLKPP